MKRILIVEDEPRLVSFLEKGLRSAGYTTSAVGDGATAIAIARDEDFDLVILDVGLPSIDGFGVLRALRGAGQRLPVIMLTARDEIADKVSGLEGGADDYMTKPFGFEELLARVKVRLRSDSAAPQESAVLQAAGVTLDLCSRRAMAGGESVELSAREFTMLETFLRHSGQVLSREQLLSHVWGYDFDPGSNVVDVYVGYLRKKLGKGRVQTVRGAGYALVDPDR